MKKILSLFAFLLFPTLFSFGAYAQQIEGAAISSDGVGVPTVRVTASVDGMALQMTTTDVNGSFSFTGLPASGVVLTFELEGFATLATTVGLQKTDITAVMFTVGEEEAIIVETPAINVPEIDGTDSPGRKWADVPALNTQDHTALTDLSLGSQLLCLPQDFLVLLASGEVPELISFPTLPQATTLGGAAYCFDTIDDLDLVVATLLPFNEILLALDISNIDIQEYGRFNDVAIDDLQLPNQILNSGNSNCIDFWAQPAPNSTIERQTISLDPITDPATIYKAGISLQIADLDVEASISTVTSQEQRTFQLDDSSFSGSTITTVTKTNSGNTFNTLISTKATWENSYNGQLGEKYTEELTYRTPTAVSINGPVCQDTLWYFAGSDVDRVRQNEIPNTDRIVDTFRISGGFKWVVGFPIVTLSGQQYNTVETVDRFLDGGLAVTLTDRDSGHVVRQVSIQPIDRINRTTRLRPVDVDQFTIVDQDFTSAN